VQPNLQAISMSRHMVCMAMTHYYIITESSCNKTITQMYLEYHEHLELIAEAYFHSDHIVWSHV